MRRKLTQKTNLLDPFVVGDILKTEDLSKDERHFKMAELFVYNRDTFKTAFFLGSIIFSLRYTVPTSGL